MHIAATDWAFATCENMPFPGTPDPAHICLKNGFNPSLLYELQAVSKTARKLAQEAYLLQQDADAMIRQAEASNVRDR